MSGSFEPGVKFHVNGPKEHLDIDADSMEVNADCASQESGPDVVELSQARCKVREGKSNISCHNDAKAQLLTGVGAWAQDRSCSRKE